MKDTPAMFLASRVFCSEPLSLEQATLLALLGVRTSHRDDQAEGHCNAEEIRYKYQVRRGRERPRSALIAIRRLFLDVCQIGPDRNSLFDKKNSIHKTFFVLKRHETNECIDSAIDLLSSTLSVLQAIKKDFHPLHKIELNLANEHMKATPTIDEERVESFASILSKGRSSEKQKLIKHLSKIN